MGTLLGLLVYIIPFVILYFVIAAAVKKGIDSSEIGRMLLEEHIEKRTKS